MVDRVEGADRRDGTDGTGISEIALRMKALFYFD